MVKEYSEEFSGYYLVRKQWGNFYPSTCLILGPSRPTTSNGIQIQSAVLPQSTRQTDMDQQADRPTDGPGDRTCTSTRLCCIDCIVSSDAANKQHIWTVIAVKGGLYVRY